MIRVFLTLLFLFSWVYNFSQSLDALDYMDSMKTYLLQDVGYTNNYRIKLKSQARISFMITSIKGQKPEYISCNQSNYSRISSLSIEADKIPENEKIEICLGKNIRIPGIAKEVSIWFDPGKKGNLII